MKHYKFEIANNRIVDNEGEVSGTSEEYQHIEKSFGVEELYAKVLDNKIVEIICEAFTEERAASAINEYFENI